MAVWSTWLFILFASFISKAMFLVSMICVFRSFAEFFFLNEPQYDKTNKMSVRPAKTQISPGIRPVWSESSLSAWRKLGSLATHWVHSEDFDQTGRMPRLIWVFAGRTHFLGFVMSRLIFYPLGSTTADSRLFRCIQFHRKICCSGGCGVNSVASVISAYELYETGPGIFISCC